MRRVKFSLPVLAAVLAVLGCANATAEFTYNIRAIVSPEYHAVNHASLYSTGSSLSLKKKFFSVRNDLELRLQWNEITLQSTLSARNQYKNDTQTSYINQLYHDGKHDTLGWTLGKKVISWGVGHGFRPLDVIQYEDRNTVNQPSLIGVPLVAIEKFRESDAFSLVWANPLKGRSHDRANKLESLALRYFRFSENHDLHLVGKFSRERKAEVGFGASYILGENTSFYGSALYTARYPKSRNDLLGRGILYADHNPMRETYHANGLRANLGFQWTAQSGFGVLFEAYYDGQAYRQKDWRKLGALTRDQVSFSSLVPSHVSESNVAWSCLAFTQENLVRENYLLRLSYDDSNGFKPYVDLLLAPEDGGLLATAAVMYERNHQRYSLGFRHYGGKKASVFRNVPENNVAWIRLELSF